MDDIDSDELLGALESIVEAYSESIGPFAIQMAQKLTNKYRTLVAEEQNDDDDEAEEKALAAAGCVTAIRRIIEAINKDKQGLVQILPVIYPILMHSLTPDGLDVIEEGLDCINIFIYYACDRTTRIPAELWKLLPQMLFIIAGKENDVDGGFAFEFLGQCSVCVQNYIAKDPETLMTVGEGQTETYFQLVLKFV